MSVLIVLECGKQVLYPSKYAAHFDLMNKYRGQQVEMYSKTTSHIRVDVIEINASGKSLLTKSTKFESLDWSGFPMVQASLFA